MNNIVPFITAFNTNKRQRVWDRDQIKMKDMFRLKLNILKMLHTQKDFDIPIEYFDKEFYRLSLGYRGINKNDGIISGVHTLASTVKNVHTTNDHVLGATEVGRFIHHEFIFSDLDIDYMVNDWLYEHLFLWGTIRMTRDEHKSCNVSRDSSYTIYDKLQLKHYLNVSDIIY